MKTFFSDLIPKIQRYSQKLDNLTLLTNQHWVVIGDNDNSKSVFIFRDNNELLISINGKVEKGKWEYLGNNSLLIDREEESFLYKHGFFDTNILALKVDGRDEYAFLVNENKSGQDLNSLAKVILFLQDKYLDKEILDGIDQASRGRIARNVSDNTNYICPKVKKIKKPDIVSFWGNITKHYHIIYADGMEGDVFYKITKQQAYFIDRKTVRYQALAHYYINLDECIKGLHMFNTNGDIVNDGFITTHMHSG